MKTIGSVTVYVLKSFGDHGNFEGIVHAVDDDNDNEGYRLFLVHYFEDPDDTESM